MLTKKGKRNCIRVGKVICSECCGKMRNIRYCDSTCEYMKQQYERIDTSSMELTELGRGKVILFSDSLFLPDVLDCFYCDVQEMKINIIEPTRISFSTKFVIRKNTDRNPHMNEAYKADAWKRNDKCHNGVPFLQIYAIGLGKINNVQLSTNGVSVKTEIENNHLDTWLPGAYSKMEKLTKKEMQEIYKGGPVGDTALVYYGEHFLGNNSTLFANIQLDKEYGLKMEIIYDNPQFEENVIVLPFGIFFPFSLVNYRRFKISCVSNLELAEASNTMLMLPFSDKRIMCTAMPLLKENAILSSPKYIPYETKKMDESFHYDNYCILHNQFKIKLQGTTVAKAIFSELPILTGVYDSFNKVYNDEYAPVSVVICNNSSEIEKYKVEVEILGASYKATKEIYVEAYKVTKLHVAPRLIEDRISHIRTNTEYDISVRVTNMPSEVVYEETEKCLLYPREVFVDILKNNTKDWKIDLKSFLARWVTPTIAQIDAIIAEAGKGLEHGIRGASSRNNMAIQNEMKSIYEVLSKNIRYGARPLAFAEGDYHAQKISLPSTTLALNAGNCIDLTILLASCYEALKLRTFIMLVPGHAFLKVELLENEIIYLESTCIGQNEYFEATEKGREKYDKYFNKKGSKVDGAHEISISLARKSSIFPME